MTCRLFLRLRNVVIWPAPRLRSLFCVSGTPGVDSAFRLCLGGPSVGLVVVVFGCLSGGSLCRPYPPELFIFSCGDFLFCRFSSNFRDLDYVGENAHDLFTVPGTGAPVY